MFKKLVTMLAVILGIVAYAPPAVAQSEEEVGPDGVYYYFDPSSRTYSVGGHQNEVSGAVVIPDFYNGYPVTSIIPEGFARQTGITSVSIGDNVESIGENAFAGCSNIKTLKLPYALKSIGDNAFGYLRTDDFNGLDGPWFDKVYLNNIEGWCSITFTDFNNPLSGVECLVVDGVETSRLEIPEGVTEISDDAFNNLWAIDEVVFPETLEKIGARAFKSCENLCSLNLPKGLVSIGEGAFESCEKLSGTLDLSGGLQTIGNYCFTRCELITGVSFGENIKTIGYRAFEECRAIENVSAPSLKTWLNIDFSYDPLRSNVGTNPLEYANHFWIGSQDVTSIDIPDDVTAIKNLTFRGGNMIVSVSLPESLVSIGASAFAGCSFPSIDLPEKLTYIGSGAFSGCSQIKAIKIPEGVRTIEEATFSNSSLESIKLPSNLTYIGNSAFYSCRNLKNIDLPYSLTFIGANAFVLCDQLESINIPYGVTTLHEGAFKSCFKLNSVELPQQLTEIENYVFQDCSSLWRVDLPGSLEKIGAWCFGILKELHCSATNPPDAAGTAFMNSRWDIYSKAVLYVPAESVSAYRSHSVWGKFLDIRAEGTSGIESVGEYAAGFEVGADGVSVSAGTCVDVYSLSGAKVRSGAEGFVPLSRGCYILVIDGTAHKVMID